MAAGMDLLTNLCLIIKRKNSNLRIVNSLSLGTGDAKKYDNASI